MMTLYSDSPGTGKVLTGSVLGDGTDSSGDHFQNGVCPTGLRLAVLLDELYIFREESRKENQMRCFSWTGKCALSFLR